MARVIIALLLVALAAEIHCGYMTYRKCNQNTPKNDYVKVSKWEGCKSRGDGTYDKYGNDAVWYICADSQCTKNCDPFIRYPLEECYFSSTSYSGTPLADGGYYTLSDNPPNDDQLMGYKSYEKTMSRSGSYSLTAITGIPQPYYFGRYLETYTCNPDDSTIIRTVTEKDGTLRLGPIVTPRTDCNIGYDIEDNKSLCMRCFY